MPAISSLSPASASAGAAAQTLTIDGSGFMSTSTVAYNGASHQASYVSSSQLTIQLSGADQSTVGSYAVVVTNPAPGGGSSNSVNFMVTGSNPMPVVTGLSPPSATAGAPAETLTIAGSGFVSASTVTYNGSAHAATFVDATQLTIQLTAADQAMTGSYAVIVTNPPPGGGVSASVDFTVGNPVPAISALSPASATAGTAGQTLTISGSAFLSGSTVTYNGTAHTSTFVSAAQLTIQLTTADQATVGNYPVVVTNPAPGGGASNTATFSVTPVVPPGATVLIMGGETAVSMPLTSAEVFASPAFSAAGNMVTARYRPTASLISAGTPGAAILVAGGWDAHGAAIGTAEIYQVATGTFGAATLAMQCAHQGHTATVLQDGKVLIAGREGKTACAEIYDPVAGTFTRTAGNMSTLVSEHAAVLLPSGKVLIAGGSTDGSGCTICASTKNAELYDPATGMFTLTAQTMNSARSSPSATLLPSGKVLIAGGGATPIGGPLRTAELYDPGTDTFTSITSTMSVGRQYHTATLLSTGKVLLAGGQINTGLGLGVTATADLYDPAAGTFQSTGSMASPRLYHTASVLGNGVVLIAGGSAAPLATATGEAGAELYDPTSGIFTMTGNLATGRYGAAASPLH
ncbi:MAG TPA: IPT/TIG domain-containing protein [Steroidobacteraceae bacterium]|nr:IPT/TIG domain-containing protein [Steroidobacteraceae bacterium]